MSKVKIVIYYVIGNLISIFLTFMLMKKYYTSIIKNNEKRMNKFVSYFNMFDQWFSLKKAGIKIDEILISKGYKKIAIYGMGVMGNHLYDELKKSNVNVEYCIDQNYKKLSCEVDIQNINKDLKYVDVIIITAVFDFDEIKKNLSEFVDYNIISLSDLLFDIDLDGGI